MIVVFSACALMTYVVANEIVDIAVSIPQTRTREKEIPIANTTTGTKTISVATSVSSSTPPEREEKHHLHHIVAKGDRRAYIAREVLWSYHIDVQRDSRNLVRIPASFHVHLHTNVYYAYVNAKILLASRTGGYNAVVGALRFLKIQIEQGVIPHC